MKTVSETIVKTLARRKTAMTAHEIAAKFNFNEKTVRNRIGELITDDVLVHSNFLQKDKVTGVYNYGYTTA